MSLIGCDINPVTIVKLTLDWDTSGQPHAQLANPCGFSCVEKCFFFADCKVVGPAADDAAALGEGIVMNLNSFQSSGQTVEIGKGITRRGSARICLEDFAVNCLDPNSQMFLSNLHDDQEYWENRLIEVYYGDCSQSLAQMEKETYVISAAFMDGCELCIDMKDPLYLLDDNNATVPEACPFEFTLRREWFANVEIIDEDTGTISDPYEQIGSFILAENYQIPNNNPKIFDCILCTEHMCIGGEIVRVAAVYNDPAVAAANSPAGQFGPPGWNFVLLERAVCGTTREDHAAGTQVARAETYRDCHVIDVLYDLLRNKAAIADTPLTCCTSAPLVTINCQSFEDYRCKHPLNIVDLSVICDEGDVGELIAELAQENLFSLSFNNTTGEINLVAWCPDTNAPADVVVDDCLIAEGGIQTEAGRERYSSVVVGYDPNNWAGSKNADNYSKRSASADADAGVFPICARRKYRTIRQLEIYSRWMGPGAAYRAKTLATQLLCLYNTPNDTLTVEVAPQVGCLVDLGSRIEFGLATKLANSGIWLVVGRYRSGARRVCWTLKLQRVLTGSQPIALGFDCSAPFPGDNLSATGACDALCLGHL